MNVVVKTVVSALLIVGISEISKRYIWAGAILASIPLISVLSMIWMYVEEHDAIKISEFCNGTFWMVLPSLTLFIIFSMLLKRDVSFYIALLIAILCMAGCYLLVGLLLRKYGII